MSEERGFILTGWHVLAGFTAAFGVIIGVNLALAYFAVNTFPGLEVKNSYVASQNFDKRRTAQEALGWQSNVTRDGDMIVLSLTDENGNVVHPATLGAIVGRPTHVRDDFQPEFTFDPGRRAYVTTADLNPGSWLVKIDATAIDGTKFDRRHSLHVRE